MSVIIAHDVFTSIFGSSVNQSHGVSLAAGLNRVLVVGINFTNQSDANVSGFSCTYDGNAMMKLAQVALSTTHHHQLAMFVIAIGDGESGTKNIAYTKPTVSDVSVVNAITLNNVNPSSINQTPVTNTNESTAASLTVANPDTTNGRIIAFLSHRQADVITPTQTGEGTQVDQQAELSYIGSNNMKVRLTSVESAGDASMVATWTLSGSCRWCCAGAAFNHLAGSPSVVPDDGSLDAPPMIAQQSSRRMGMI